MSELDMLLKAYELHVSTPWSSSLSGSERVWFAVYSPANERRLARRIDEFAIATRDANFRWKHLDLTDAFPRWLTSLRHAEGFFKRPEGYPEQRFAATVAERIKAALDAAGPDEVVAVTGVGTLFGLTKLSSIIKSVEGAVKGRLLVFFPGVREGSAYKMFDTGDGWNYLAVPITARYGELQ